uniref:BED-type domain-containing protein n=1 Tax=Globodera rostochiensis TaxID=31243 RepID=A0A914IHK5_GLORO
MVNPCDKSSWWFYFDRTGKTRAKCKHCPTEIEQGRTKSTAKLEWHLKTKHPIIYQVKNKAKKEQKEAKKEVLQNKLNFITPCTEQTQAFQMPKERMRRNVPHHQLNLEQIREPLRQLIKRFRNGQKMVKKTTETEDLVMIMMRGRRYYREVVLPRVLERLRAKMLEEIKSVDWLSITSDIWSSKDYNHSLLAITAHFIDLAARPQFRVIATVPLKEIHKTGQIISGHLLKALKEVQIDKAKIHLFLRDGASNMVLAAQTAGFDSFHCFLHIINLAIKILLKLRDPLQPPETFELCDAIVAKLDSLFSGWERKKFLICATVLDPRVKLKLFEHLRERARAWLSGDLRLMTNSVGSILRARADSGPISENDVFAEMIDDADSIGFTVRRPHNRTGCLYVEHAGTGPISRISSNQTGD